MEKGGGEEKMTSHESYEMNRRDTPRRGAGGGGGENAEKSRGKPDSCCRSEERPRSVSLETDKIDSTPPPPSPVTLVPAANQARASCSPARPPGMLFSRLLLVPLFLFFFSCLEFYIGN